MSYAITPQVTKLLQQYSDYKKINSALSRLSLLLAKSKLRKLDTSALQIQYDELSQQLQQLSDDMTFDSPHTWIQYKYEAYKDEAQPILTMHDLRVHCSKPNYICTKRYTFLNHELIARRLPPLTDAATFPDELSLGKLLDAALLHTVMADAQFMNAWRHYEYHKDGARIAKWENYTVPAGL